MAITVSFPRVYIKPEEAASYGLDCTGMIDNAEQATPTHRRWVALALRGTTIGTGLPSDRRFS